MRSAYRSLDSFANLPVRSQQCLDPRSHLDVAATGFVKVSLKLLGRILLQSAEKNPLGIECDFAHRRTPVIPSFTQCPV
jgi:hypothetical protein